MRKEYIKTRQCIWCSKKSPEVSFRNIPHVIPNSLGGKEIGFDICDECNAYFGTAKQGQPSVDLVYKEIFNCFRIFSSNLNENTYKKFNSTFFKYTHSKRTITIKRGFEERVITRQFKRGLYEVFLQKYHLETGNGNHPMFDLIRNFARYDIGNPHVFYAFNNIIFAPDNKDSPILLFNDEILNEMMDSGLYMFYFLGRVFYIEISSLVFNANGYRYLQKQANEHLIPVDGTEKIFEFSNIMQIDFLMQRFNSRVKS